MTWQWQIGEALTRLLFRLMGPTQKVEARPTKKIVGKAIVWGVRELRSVVNLPDGVIAVRIRMRPVKPAVIYLRFADRVECWVLGPLGQDMRRVNDAWELVEGCCQGVNVKLRDAHNR